ncbi:MFS transporter [Oceanobacillus chungangensis]|uniref:Putative proline/betaine transporter n=1 Tax=Oceanobacillus chungangensis TaxID=1229152 RepID=A0A3D8PWQ3_9BACI|nr:MFS transporter [Oceanobacillus chungangensis]RDW19741.1 MFS transporter [Oceanobacillus chungangensis]
MESLGEDARVVDTAGLRKSVFGAAIGNLIEWFDYATYGYLATVIAAVFFAPGNETAALLATFAVFAASFIVRPLGGVIWGYYGDRIGRKRILVLTVIIMSLSTFMIGIIPGYASIGIAAPILLLVCRLVQGFSASGEYAGAAAFIAEHAPDSKRGLLVSMVPASTAAGLVLGAIIASLLEFNLSTEALQSWGWRIPFLLSAPLGIFALFIRLKLEDAELFKEMEKKEQSSNKKKNTSMLKGIKQNFRQVVAALGVVSLNAVGFYIILTYMPTYLSQELGFNAASSILTTILSLGSYVLLLPLIGFIADRVGRKPVLITACVLFLLLTYPTFVMLSWGGVYAILAQILLGAILAGNDGVLATFLSEMFPTNVRYSCFALSFNSSNALFGGTAPFVATFLIATTNNTFAPAFYLMGAAVVAFIALFWTKETANQPLR